MDNAMKNTSDAASLRAIILRIQRLSTEDGPGIRSTVFFKGCPLACTWCHNPESISPHFQIHWEENRCIGCRSCIDACENGALSLTSDGMQIDRDKCTGCLSCTKACPSTALEAFGKSWQIHELVKEVLKDSVYFEKSKGGITLSGGEPAMQAPFAAELLRSLQQKGIHMALDTCGLCPQKTLDMLLDYTDLVLFDIKEIDPERHKLFTGLSNKRILENLIFTGERMKEKKRPTKLWIRTPIIPQCTATKENIQGIGAFITENLSGLVSRWELCAFNNLCTHKYEGLGIEWACKDYKLMSTEAMEYLSKVAKTSGVDPHIVQVSGATLWSKDEETPADQRASMHLAKGDIHV
jgi:pyruvate formate lyase activating enzyme